MALHCHSVRQRGFTLAELLISTGLLSLLFGIAYAFLSESVSLYVRNLSINKSDNSLRYAMQRLKRDISLAASVPQLVAYDPTQSSPALIAAPAGTTAAQGIRILVTAGPAYGLLPAGVSSDVPPASCSVPVYSSVNQLQYRLARCTSTGSLPLPVASSNPRHNDRLVFLYPSPIPVQNVTEGSGASQAITAKPGRRIRSATVVSNNYVDVTVEDLSGAGQPLPPVMLYNSVQVVHEVAYVAYNYADGGGNRLRELRYFPHAEDPSIYHVICRDLDPNPQEKINGSTVQPFTLMASSSGASLNINLPVRAVDYAQAIAERNVPPGQINASSEFNVFISAKPQVSPRVLLF